MPDRNRQILIVETPKGTVGREHFRLAEAPLPTPQEGEVLARVRYISLDAANRAWMQGATYRSAVEAGSVMAGGALAEIVESKSPALRPGDLVFGDTGWQDYAVLPAKRAARICAEDPLRENPFTSRAAMTSAAGARDAASKKERMSILALRLTALLRRTSSANAGTVSASL